MRTTVAKYHLSPVGALINQLAGKSPCVDRAAVASELARRLGQETRNEASKAQIAAALNAYPV